MFDNKFKAAMVIPTWRRPQALTRMFKKCPALNSPHVYIGIEEADKPAYALWRRDYANKVTIVNVTNPLNYCSDAFQCIHDGIPLKQYERVVFSDDNTAYTDKALYSLLYAHSLYPRGIMTGTNPIGTMFHRDSIAAGETFKVPKAHQAGVGASEMTIFDQLNMTMWVMPSDIYAGFTHEPHNYAWDIELVLYAVLEGGVREIKGCLEAMFQKHKHDFKETKQTPARKLEQLGESISILARRYPEQAKPTWMTYHVDIRRILNELIKGALK